MDANNISEGVIVLQLCIELRAHNTCTLLCFLIYKKQIKSFWQEEN